MTLDQDQPPLQESHHQEEWSLTLHPYQHGLQAQC
jgi:hypothetical protein